MKQTPLNRIHKQLGARMVEFAGWEMPVLYTGVMEEHLAVRKKAGLFDVSHMGEIEIRGPGAEVTVQRVTCNDVSRLKTGSCQYSALLTERGTFVDDIIVNKLASDRFLLCVNAGNAEKDFEWIRSHADRDTTVEDTSDAYFQIALQGPRAVDILVGASATTDGRTPLPAKPFTFLQTKLADRTILIARTGYTGEDGFEIYGGPEDAETIWSLLAERGATPCGLGARDTLRLEAALSLYGYEIDDTLNPYEAGLGWIVKMEKGDFVGREALGRILYSPLPKRLIGLEMTEPGIARQGYKIFQEEKEIGWVTSGTQSPSLDRAIALGYVRRDFATVGTKIEVDIHRKKRHAMIVPLPFYRRK